MVTVLYDNPYHFNICSPSQKVFTLHEGGANWCNGNYGSRTCHDPFIPLDSFVIKEGTSCKEIHGSQETS